MLQNDPMKTPLTDAPLTDAPVVETPPEPEPEKNRAALAPVWHTAVLVIGIAAISVRGSTQMTGRMASGHFVPDRMLTYGMTALMELLMLGWVVFGLRLRKIPLRTLIGSTSGGMRALMQDAGVALVFWLMSLMVLGTVGVVWTGVEAAVTHKLPEIRAGKPIAPSAEQRKTLRVLSQLAPTNGEEVAGWVLLCLLVGFVEETVFRGYLQQQFTAWAHGADVAGVVFSALAFGSAHGYEGARSMVLLAVFGALFSLLALYRRGLRACMFAHSWHDLIAGLTIAFLSTHHLLGT